MNNFARVIGTGTSIIYQTVPSDISVHIHATMLLVLFHPLSLYSSTYTYAHVLYFLVPFSRYDIFTPFRKHVTSWLSWYRSADKKEHAATCAFVFTMAHRRPWSVDWRRFPCKRKTFHLPRWPVGGRGGGGKFSRTTATRGHHLSLWSLFCIPSFHYNTSALLYRSKNVGCNRASKVGTVWRYVENFSRLEKCFHFEKGTPSEYSFPEIFLKRIYNFSIL